MQEKRYLMKSYKWLVIIILFLFGFFVHLVHAETVFTEDFESGWGNWWSDNGVWEVGTPTVGPDTIHGGGNCAGTVLDGNIPTGSSSRMISPSIMLPDVQGDEEIHLRFWQWFSFYYSHGYVQISVYDEDTWSDWETISDNIRCSTPNWSLMNAELTNYAGKRVRIAFYFTEDWHYELNGWYIDDITISRYLPNFTGNFELSWEHWSADNGVWEVGTPLVGPDNSHGGNSCAGTVLDGDSSGTESRLISPSVILPEVEGYDEIHLRFWQWFSFNSGYIQISLNEDGAWSDWETISDEIGGSSPNWSLMNAELTNYAGKKVRIAFYNTGSGTGWYIDDVSITGLELIITPDIDLEQPNAYLVLTDDTAYTLPAGSSTTVYGCSGGNNITLESGTGANLQNFEDENVITIRSESSFFTVSRSGSTVTLEGTDRTILSIPATSAIQTIKFNDDSYELKIETGVVYLDDQEVTEDPTPIMGQETE